MDEFEVVVVDDGCTDDSMATVNSYQGMVRLRTVIGPAKGIAAAINVGVASASAAIIARQDADDYSHPRRLEMQYTYLRNHGSTAVVGTLADRVDEDGHELPYFSDVVRNGGQARAESGPRARRIVSGSAMMRRDVLEEVGGYREALRFASDLDLWQRIGERYRMANVDRRLYYFRIHSKSMWGTGAKYGQVYSGIVHDMANSRRQTGRDALDNGLAEFRRTYADVLSECRVVDSDLASWLDSNRDSRTSLELES